MGDEPNKAQGIDWNKEGVHYKSVIWKEGLVASEVFIMPSVTNGHGIRHLITYANQGVRETYRIARELAHSGRLSKANVQVARIKAAAQQYRLRDEHGVNAISDRQVSIAAGQAGREYESSAIGYQCCLTECERVGVKSEQLRNVAQSLLTMQEEKGDEITTSPECVKKLMVAVKCIDSIWAGIVELHGLLRESLYFLGD